MADCIGLSHPSCLALGQKGWFKHKQHSRYFTMFGNIKSIANDLVTFGLDTGSVVLVHCLHPPLVPQTVL